MRAALLDARLLAVMLPLLAAWLLRITLADIR